MFKLLEGTSSSTGSGISMWIMIALAAVLLVVMFITKSKGNKKYEMERQELLSNLKKGTKVITSFGIYGEVVEVKETTDGKVVLIASGDEKHKTYMNVHINAIMNIDAKQDVVYDADGNDITPYDEIEKNNENVNEENDSEKDGSTDLDNSEVAEVSDSLAEEKTKNKSTKKKK